MNDVKPIEIEGLSPWVASGELNLILGHIAAWYDDSDINTEIELILSLCRVSDDPVLHTLPCLLVRMSYGPRSHAGFGEIKIWRGASPTNIRKVLDACEAGCRLGNKIREREGVRAFVTPTEIELKPNGGHELC